MSEAKPPPSAGPDATARELDQRIHAFARRRTRARSRGPGKSLWAQATWVGTVGWLVAVPIAIGAFLGHLLDVRLGSGITWAMAFMGLGVLAGGYALWRLGYDVRAQEDDDQHDPPDPPDHHGQHDQDGQHDRHDPHDPHDHHDHHDHHDPHDHHADQGTASGSSSAPANHREGPS